MPSPPDLHSLTARVGEDIERAGLRALNGLRLLSGVSPPAAAGSPRRLVWSRDNVSLHRYDSDRRSRRPPVLLVMSLVTRPRVFDLQPGSSLVEHLLARGFDVFLLDWGVPGPVEAANTWETYCDEYLPLAAEATRHAAGADEVSVLGYCLGGVLALLFAAGHTDCPLRNLVLLATPIDFSTFGPVVTILGAGRVEPGDVVDETGNVPAQSVLDGIRLLQPMADISGTANLWQHLDDRRFVDAYRALTGWSRDHVPFPGAAFEQMIELFVRDQALVRGVVPLGGRDVRLSAISCPVLSVTGQHDHLVPPRSSDPLTSVLTNTKVDELRIPAGHVGLLVGRQAQTLAIPMLLEWLEARSSSEMAG